MLEIVFTNKMKHDVKIIKKRGKNLSKLTETLNLLASREPMPKRYKDHQLAGNLKDFRECHIEPDWLLIYQIFDDILILSASGTGTHSDLFS
ncbi:MAG: type II toxin-antitoxin system YafQ family toxin [Treponema sp.]|nr:type II toxin-antitoxin system YafQ family toxin [Treponema sp.]